MLDIAALLEPCSPEAVCGSDLEYDADFLALEESARVKPERQVGDSIIPAEMPDWRSVYPAALALASRSKDFRIAVTLTRAACMQEGLQGLAGGLALIDGLCERYWPEVFPLLDAEDNNDPTMRINALSSLVDESGLLGEFGAVALASARGVGTVKVREALASMEVMTPITGDQSFTTAQAEAVLQTAIGEGTEAVNWARQALESARSIESRIRSATDSYESISLQTLCERLSAIADLVDRVLALFAPQAQSAVSDGADEGPSRALSGEVTSRDDALRALEKVVQYLERSEPTNPAPLLIRRAQRLMTMSFIDIMRDMAPDALAPIQNIAGLKDQDPDQM